MYLAEQRGWGRGKGWVGWDYTRTVYLEQCEGIRLELYFLHFALRFEWAILAALFCGTIENVFSMQEDTSSGQRE